MEVVKKFVSDFNKGDIVLITNVCPDNVGKIIDVKFYEHGNGFGFKYVVSYYIIKDDMNQMDEPREDTFSSRDLLRIPKECLEKLLFD